MTMRAVWNDTVIAESSDTVQVEGNHYFPPDDVRWEHFTPSSRSTTCPWKGRARYYSVQVGDEVNPDAAWVYPTPLPAAETIKDHVAFWSGVRVDAA